MQSDRFWCNAFVIQFDEETDVAAGRFVGRIEHVASFRWTRFQSLPELLAFIEHVLAGATAPPEGDKAF